MSNYISVIITAYNRKEYLLDAIKSVINQTLNRGFYEIIVVKNFHDKDIDNYITENKVKEINMEGTVREFLRAAILESWSAPS
ncbi:MAG: glycosyltransferase [Thermoplasmata archaeon]